MQLELCDCGAGSPVELCNCGAGSAVELCNCGAGSPVAVSQCTTAVPCAPWCGRQIIPSSMSCCGMLGGDAMPPAE